ncbi:MAG: hypothetical protein JSW50_02125 [Candidatus Latescibacterota bacterium]|nr:MAG: hypothetical protein JSW50_02125 [Candidatus Latescibacterota bacterium]
MPRILATGFALILLVLCVGIASAQIPFIGVYFDNTWQAEATMACQCPPDGTIDTLYIALTNANTFVTGVEFKVNYPAVAFSYLGDIWTQPVTVGTTATGISMGWPNPQNGFTTIPICGVIIVWNCGGCCPQTDIPLSVVTNPNTTFLGFTDFPNFLPVPAVGLTSTICACSIPVEESTWGKVKSLYQE